MNTRLGYHLAASAALVLLFLCTCKAQDAGWATYSSSWDFTAAASKLDAVAQAQANAYFSLFNPSNRPMGAEAQVKRVPAYARCSSNCQPLTQLSRNE